MKRFIYCLIAMACCASQSVFASIDIQPGPLAVPGNWVDFDTTPGRTGSGGPFLGRVATTSAGLASSSNTWLTFCVEAGPTSEPVELNSNPAATSNNYRIGSISSNVASNTQNVATQAAKLVYYWYGHNGVGAATGAEVQEVIWSLVVQGGGAGAVIPAFAGINAYPVAYPDGPNANYWLTEAGSLTATAASLRQAAINAVTIGNTMAALALADRIKVMNPVVYNTNGTITHKQSMLFEIPEAATIVVWSLLGLTASLFGGRRQRG